MRIFSLKKNKDGDTECQFSLKGFVVILAILFGVKLISSMIMAGGGVVFVKTVEKQSEKR